MQQGDAQGEGESALRPAVEPYAWYGLGVLMLVYVLNFVDRQLLTILAPALKRDLGISDSDFGFLYGTAFGVFYALFGIPLGRLADRWIRVRLLALGLALWSAMTALSGFARGFGELAAARIGVGVGEASASPCAYSLIGDWFPPHRRATALAIYSAGLYIGAGVSLFLGSSISQAWDGAFRAGDAPLGLAGWQAAFMAVGLPGVLLAVWVATLREPVRNHLKTAAPGSEGEAGPGLWSGFLRDLSVIVPPFTLWGAARRGRGAFAANIGLVLLAALAAWGLTALFGDPPQWIALALGCYALASWASDLRDKEPAAFRAVFGSRPFLAVVIGYGLVSLVGYAGTAFGPLYVIEAFGMDPNHVALIIGGMGAVGGGLGVITGGALADRLAMTQGESGRVLVLLLAATLSFAAHALIFTTQSVPILYVGIFAGWFLTSATLGGASGAIVGMVAPHLRGLATATFIVGTTLIGLALGPYAAGKLAQTLGSLREGLLGVLAVAPLSIGLLALAWRDMVRRRG